MRTPEVDAPTSCTVLIIDDEPQIIELITLVLQRKYGKNIIGAVGGTEGLAKAREFIPDLVILDIMMPDPDGYEACKQLKGTLTLQDTPILFIASKPPKDVYPIAHKLGARGYLTEPFGPLELLTACEALLRGDLYYPEERYFPLGVLDTDPQADQFKRNWYSKILQAMGEPPFTQPGLRNREIYRFLWIRTFHHPIAIRLEKRDDHCVLVAKELERSGYEPSAISKEVSKSISSKEWSKFISLLEDACFWEMPPDTMGFALDGALWLLESQREGKYQLVTRHSPRAEGSDAGFRAACLHLLALSRIEVPPREVY